MGTDVSSAKRGGLATDVRSGPIFLTVKKKKDIETGNTFISLEIGSHGKAL